MAPYPIGTPGVRWGAAQVAEWLSRQSIRRSYAAEVLQPLEALKSRFELLQYGQLEYPAGRYPLVALKSPRWDDSLPSGLVTGGVHGYETSGVQGALEFARGFAARYAGRMNLLVAPCVSPWGYEVIQRWNVSAVDPNRSFKDRGLSPESAALMQLVAPLQGKLLVHIDLHETTDTDESEFRPAVAARDGVAYVPDVIPDGFYLVDDSAHPQPPFQQAIIQAVGCITHIAAADRQGNLIGLPMVAPGVINIAVKRGGLCAGMTDAPYKTTTEVYPDSPRTSPEICIRAQVTAVCAALDFVLETR